MKCELCLKQSKKYLDCKECGVKFCSKCGDFEVELCEDCSLFSKESRSAEGIEVEQEDYEAGGD